MKMTYRFFRETLTIIKVVFCLLFMLSSLMIFENVYGSKQEIPQNKATDETGFTVSPVIPDSQIDESKGFYFIKVKPNEEQELSLNIKNTSSKKKEVAVSVNNAYTNPNGNIDYDGKHKRDDTLKDSLEEITTLSTKKVTLEKGETKEVKIKVKPPSESFQGVKIAAINVMNIDSNEKKQGLSSSYGYRVGLVITEDEDVDYNNGTSLNFLKVNPAISHGKRVIQARLQNPEPKIIDNLTVETKLRKKGSKEVLRKRTTNDMRMAPNSQFDFATNWGVDPIKPGTYVLSVKATSNKKSWKWSKEFTIGEEQAKKINEEASYTLTYPKWVPIVVILLGILTITIIGCLYLRRKKWTETK